MNQSMGRPRRRAPATPSIAWTKPPPKRVRTFALRWRTRMTVSAPEIFARCTSSSGRLPKSRVAVSRTLPGGVLPGPTPQPAKTTVAHTTPSRRAVVLADMEHDAVGSPAARVVAVEGRVDGVGVEDVAAAGERAREEVVDRRGVPDAEPEAVGGAAARRSVQAEALRAPAEVRAAPAIGARQAQLDDEQAGRAGVDDHLQPPRALPAGEALTVRDPAKRRSRRRVDEHRPRWGRRPGGRRRVAGAGRRRHHRDARRVGGDVAGARRPQHDLA